MKPDVSPQRVVVYTNLDGDAVPYSTAYTDEQADYYLQRCLVHHGSRSKPRVRRA